MLQNKHPLKKSGSKRYCFVVVKDGVIVHEDYWQGTTADTKFETDSLGKTVSAALIGVAVSKGLIDLDKTLASYGVTPQADWGKYWEKITARHLLAQTSGLGKVAPGEYFTYDSDQYIQHLSYLLTKVTPEKSAFKFGKSEFAKFLGVPDLYKYDNVNPEVSIGGGQLMTCRQIARVGQLILNKGKWMKSSGELYDMLTADYVKAWTTPAFPNVASSYGFLTWLNTKPSDTKCCAPRWGSPWVCRHSNRLLSSIVGDDVEDADVINCPFDVSIALGWLGKYLFTIPERNMVVVSMGNSWGSSHLCDARGGGYDDAYTMTESWKAFGNLTIPSSNENASRNIHHPITSSLSEGEPSNQPLSYPQHDHDLVPASTMMYPKTHQRVVNTVADSVDNDAVAVGSCYCYCPPSQGFGRCYNIVETSPKESADECATIYQDGARVCPTVSVVREKTGSTTCSGMRISNYLKCTDKSESDDINSTSEGCPCLVTRFETCSYYSSPCDDDPYFPVNLTLHG